MVAVGQIARPHGLKGAVRVMPLTDTPGRFLGLSRVSVEKTDGSALSMDIESAREVPGAALISFRGIDTVEQADELRNAYLLVPREEIPPLPEDTFYIFEIIGFEAHTEEGRRLGVVRDVLRLPANDAYVVGSGDEEILIPAVKDFVRVDTVSRRIVVRGIEDLLA